MRTSKSRKKTTMMRPASEEDLASGRALFHIPEDRSSVYDLGAPLPLQTALRVPLEDSEGNLIPAGTSITIVQAEIVDETDILIGFLYYDGKEGVCFLEQTEYEGPP